MNRETFLACIGRLHPRQMINLNFMPGANGIPGVCKLLSLSQVSSGMEISRGMLMNLAAVADSSRWESVSRMVPVFGLMSADQDLAGAIAPHLESVNTDEHFAQGLFTNNQPRQKAALDRIIAAVLTGAILHDVEDWGLTASGVLHEINGLPAVKFTVLHLTRPIFRVCIDGFSGRMQVSSQWSDHRCIDAGPLQSAIRHAVESYVERTAGATSQPVAAAA